MKPIYLYAENFMSHEKSEIDFTGITAALVIGKLDNNDLISNGVGKSSIFRAIEYCLFNQTRDALQQKDLLLENLIKEDAKKCKVIFDFSVNDEIFRVIRARTDKGVADLGFYIRTPVNGNAHRPETDKELWSDISSRRAQDTEADLAKKIRINYKAFINTVHFQQFDFGSGLSTATPAHRKTILKEALDLLVYSKLEKLTKTNSDAILKDIEKHRTMLLMFGDPTTDIKLCEEKNDAIDKEIQSAKIYIDKIKEQDAELGKIKEQYNAQLVKISTSISSILTRRDNISADISKINNSISDFTLKRKSIISEAKQITSTLETLKAEKLKLESIDFSAIETIKNDINNSTIELATLRSQRSSLNIKLDELNIPLPEDGTCKHCRQPLTDTHRRRCLEDIENEKISIKNQLTDLSELEKTTDKKQNELKKTLRELESNLSIFNSTVNKIVVIEKEFADKKTHHKEYSELIEKFATELNDKKDRLEQIKSELQNSSEQEMNELKQKIDNNKAESSKLAKELEIAVSYYNSLNNKKAIILHTIDEKKSDINKKIETEKTISNLEVSYSIYPLVIEAFSSTGIPSLIIKNVLEDLQTEANNLLSQLRPGLQLEFEIEKEKDDGSKDDTLDITYFLNNKPRDYNQLSGAQKVCVMFSLKLSLSFLLKKLMGAQINFLLLDEVDQPLDKAGCDALSNIIKYFQKDFTILVITHNDRLKDKFNTAILVEQDQNMVSRAKVVSNW